MAQAGAGGQGFGTPGRKPSPTKSYCWHSSSLVASAHPAPLPVTHLSALKISPAILAIEWTARAASEFLSRSLAGALDGPVLSAPSLNRAGSGLGASPANVPGESNDRAKAELAGANRLVSGYIERVDGKIRVSASEENLVNHRTVRILSAEADQPIAAIRQLANEFSPSARPYLTSNSDVLRALRDGLGRAFIERHTGLAGGDTKGPGVWARLGGACRRSGNARRPDGLARGCGSSSQAEARSRRQGRHPASEGRSGERQTGAVNRPQRFGQSDFRRSGSASYSGRGPNGGGAIRSGSRHWKKVREAAPGDRNAWNQAGYALAWSGDFSGAIHAMKEYAARWPADPNPLDSTGDVYYMYGKFADAAANYLKGNEKSSQFLTGGELYKAAWAQFRAGDKVKAESQLRAVSVRAAEIRPRQPDAVRHRLALPDRPRETGDGAAEKGCRGIHKAGVESSSGRRW